MSNIICLNKRFLVFLMGISLLIIFSIILNTLISQTQTITSKASAACGGLNQFACTKANSFSTKPLPLCKMGLKLGPKGRCMRK